MNEARYYRIQTFEDRYGRVAWGVDPIVMLALHTLRDRYGHSLALTANAVQRGVAELWLQAHRSGFYTVPLLCWFKCRARTLHSRRLAESEAGMHQGPCPTSLPWRVG